MGKSAGRPPPAPDPNAIAAAQTASNIQTARTQAELNRVNQVTPYGSLTYTQDPGNPDRWTAAQTLSPAEQHMLDVTNEGQSIYGAAALTQLRSGLCPSVNGVGTAMRKASAGSGTVVARR